MHNLNQKGSILIILIITIIMLSVLSAGILSMTITSTFSELNVNNSNRAKYLAEAGIRYAKLNNLPDPTDETYTLSNGDKFHILIAGTTLESTGIVKEDTPLEAMWKITSSDYTPSTNTPPVFTTDPIHKANAIINQLYIGQTLAGSATDADGDPLTYSKVTGPGWLNIAPDGTLSGMPGSGDNGMNMWTVEVSDGRGGTDQATLMINVKKK
jgi:type II secretory pathway pseudopilin PulG